MLCRELVGWVAPGCDIRFSRDSPCLSPAGTQMPDQCMVGRVEVGEEMSFRPKEEEGRSTEKTLAVRVQN